MAPDLSLSALSALFWRPGGKKAQSANRSRQLFQMKRAVAAAVYHGTPIPVERFWQELMITARSYYLHALSDNKGFWGLLREGQGKKGSYLTAAGWIRSVAWWLYYFRSLEVMKMAQSYFEPTMEPLKRYFGPEPGIDTEAKAYAYLLGILYGKLLEVQGARGVNVGANALTWLKRLTLRGKDLPELYVKVRGKLLSYGTEKSEKVRELIQEIGRLGVKLGDPIDLDQTQTNYYLLLGQSLARSVLGKDDLG
jgi:CRISPR-associated protein Csh1